MNFLDIGQIKDIYADGINDDARAIQRCLDEMKDGGTIYFPDGTYLISHCLIFYSNQWLKFSDNAVLLRADNCSPITKYMLASYSEPSVGGYDGTHDVVISGGIFDGNSKLTENLTILNTVHCQNITVKNCTFRHCAYWHCIELNSTKGALILDCIFDGKSYTAMRENLTSELVQIDAPATGTYGPVYNCRDELIDFLPDRTPCCDITIASCIFKCGGFTAIGHHGNDAHHNIKILCNVFEGLAGNERLCRGFITFMQKVYDVEIAENAFISHSDNEKCIGISASNPDKKSIIAQDNKFIGKFDEEYSGAVTTE